MKIFDIHTHIYPDDLADRVVRALSDRYDGLSVQCSGRLNTLIERMDAAGITACACHSVATGVKQVANINRFILDSVRLHPGRLIPFATLHPDLPDPGAAVDSLVAAGFRGIKLHPEMQGFLADEPRAVELFSAIGSRLPVLLHCGDPRYDHSSPARIRRLLRQVPGIRLICAHLGGWTLWERAARELASENLWVDLSSSLSELSPKTSVDIIRSYGIDRVLFGTDYPVFDPKQELERFMALPLTDDEREKILWRNHRAVLFGES